MTANKFIALGICTLNLTLCFGQVLTNAEYADLVNSIKSGCISNQKNSISNSNITNQQLSSYCQCYATTIITKQTTQQDIKIMYDIGHTQGNAAALSFILKGADINAIANTCTTKALR